MSPDHGGHLVQALDELEHRQHGGQAPAASEMGCGQGTTALGETDLDLNDSHLPASCPWAGH